MRNPAFVKSNAWIAAKKSALAAGLTEKELSLTPMCNTCGWRKGGLDSWDGRACKCGHTSPTFLMLFSITKEFWVHADGHRVEIISTNRRIEVRGARFGIDGWLSCEECREFLASQGYTREQK